MMYLLMLIIPDRDNLQDLLSSLHSAGAMKITTLNAEEFLPTNDDQPLQENFPIIPSFQTLTDLSQRPAKIVLAFGSSKNAVEELNRIISTYLEESEIKKESSFSVFKVGDITSLLM